MKNIELWFNNGCDFEEGVAIYKALSKTSPNVLRALARGKNSYNKSLLIKELRIHKNIPTELTASKKITKTPPKQHVNDAELSEEKVQETTKQSALKKEYGSIKYAHLPPELKLRYRELGNIFYQMCDLKFILNDLKPKEESHALQIILQIEELDDQRTMIWNELDHWNNHKVVLPTQTSEYTGLNSDELRTKKARLASNITKLEKRIDAKYKLLFDNPKDAELKATEESIRRSEKKLHQHKLNVLKINELL